MKDRIEINGVLYVKEEPKKEKINYFIKVVAGEVFVYGSRDLSFPGQLNFESKMISKEEADYASNKPTEGDWEFRVPKKGETILGYCGGGHHIEVRSWKEKGPLSGRRWVKKEEPKKEDVISKWFIRENVLGEVDVIEAVTNTWYLMMCADTQFTRISKEEAYYASSKPIEGEWEFRVPKKGESHLLSPALKDIDHTTPYTERLRILNNFLSGRRWVKKEEKEITFEELYKTFQSYYRNAPFCDNMDGDTRVFLERVENQISAKD